MHSSKPPAPSLLPEATGRAALLLWFQNT